MHITQHAITKWVDVLCRRGEYIKAISLLSERVSQFSDESWATDLLERVRLAEQQSALMAKVSIDGFDGGDLAFIESFENGDDEWTAEDIEAGVILNVHSDITIPDSEGNAKNLVLNAVEIKISSDSAQVINERIAPGLFLDGENGSEQVVSFEEQSDSGRENITDRVEEVPAHDEDDFIDGTDLTSVEPDFEADFDSEELDLISEDADAWADVDVGISEVEFEGVSWSEGEDSTLPIDPEVLGSGRIEIERRARIQAASLILDVEWLRRDLPLLQEILAFHHCHSKTIGALRDLIPRFEVKPFELKAAFELRIYWVECEHFHRGWNSVDELAAVTWQNISWGLALAIQRHLGSSDLDEITDWLSSCFDDWTDWHIKGRHLPSFHSYLVYLLSHLDSQEEITGQRLPAYLDFDLFSESDEAFPGSPLWREFESYGLFSKRLERRSCYTDREIEVIARRAFKPDDSK